MFNIKWSVIPAVAAFILALLLSLFLGRANFTDALLRALLFAVIFFVLGAGIKFLINTFIPELMFPDRKTDSADNVFGQETPGPGTRINISLGETINAALPNTEKSQEKGEVDNINDSAAIRKKSDIDQNDNNSYTGNEGEFAPSQGGSPEEDKGEEDFFMNFESYIPDFMKESFSEDEDSSKGQNDKSLPERKVSSNKPMKLEGDFNPKEIAAGIRTVLEKDKKG